MRFQREDRIFGLSEY